MDRVCGPALIAPPFGPIVAVDCAKGRSEHLRNPVALPNEPMRLACGACGAAVGVWSVHANASDAHSATTTRRVAFIRFPYLEKRTCLRGPTRGTKWDS